MNSNTNTDGKKSFSMEINQLYEEILHRPADAQGLDYYDSLIRKGQITLKDIGNDLRNSQEARIINYEKIAKKLNDTPGSPNIGRVQATSERLGQLLKISKSIIAEFGLGYYLRVGFEEFRKRKFSILKPDFVQAVDGYTEQFQKIDYNYWLQHKQLVDMNSEIVKNSLLKLNYLPSFAIYVFIDDSDLLEESLLTVNSVSGQIYPKWTLHVVGNKNTIDKLIQNLDDNTRDKINLIPSQNISKIDEIILTHKDDYLGFSNSGKIFYPESLFRFVNFLNKNPDSDIVYCDEDELDENRDRSNPFFKPDWSPYLILGMDYIDFYFVKKQIFQQSGGFTYEPKEGGSYDLLLRCAEITDKITHLPLPMISSLPNQNKKKVKKNQIKIVQDTLTRRNIEATVHEGLIDHSLRVKFKLDHEPKVSIIIPTRDQRELLQRCIIGLEKNTDYKNWEILLVDNNSVKQETLYYLDSLPYKKIKYSDEYNFSKINNIAAKYATGDFLLFLNDDTASIDPTWLTEMVSLCSQPDVGAVGAKLLYKNDTIQHAGLVFLKTGAGFHPFQRNKSNDPGYFGFENTMRDFSAVTASCMIMKRDLFEKVGGFDETFDLYYGDADLCFKIKELGYKVLYTPFAKVLHEGSTKTRKEAEVFFAVENHYRFIRKWPFIKNGDPSYNPNLDLNYQYQM